MIIFYLALFSDCSLVINLMLLTLQPCAFFYYFAFCVSGPSKLLFMKIIIVIVAARWHYKFQYLQLDISSFEFSLFSNIIDENSLKMRSESVVLVIVVMCIWWSLDQIIIIKIYFNIAKQFWELFFDHQITIYWDLCFIIVFRLMCTQFSLSLAS